MGRKSIQLGFFIVALAASAAAQTTTNVTNTDNGTTNVVPVYSGAAAVTNSTIYASGGNVGIKTGSNSLVGLLELSAPDQSAESAIAIRQSNNLNDGFDFGISQSTGMGYLYAVSGTTSNPIKTALEQFDPVNNYVIFNGGKVGIGTVSPAFTLDVAGQIRSSAGGIVFPDGSTQTTAYSQLAPGQASVTNGNNGTTGSFPYYTGNASLSSTSVITQSGSNVGIGTTTPSTALQIYDGTYSQNAISGWNSVLDIDRAGTTIGGITSDGNTEIGLFTGASDAWTNVKFAINGSGDVGIGTTTPLSALTLAGSNTVNPNPGPQVDYAGENLSFENNQVGKAIGDIKMVQPTGYYVDAGDMVLSTSYGTLAERMRITAQGNVGIGTTAPAYNLDVSGVERAQSGIIYPDGNKQTVAWTGVLCGGDYAESVDVNGDLKHYGPGDILVLSSDKDGEVEKASETYSTTVAGIYATKPGVIGRRQSLSKDVPDVPMAMVGIVPAKVSAENGPIHRGDLLVTASIPGYAMKGTDRSRMLGAVVGKAMSSLDSGTGVIEVLVTLQ